MNKKPAPPLKVIELFAGVGGFREAMSTPKTKDFYNVIWSNQWEPKESKKTGDKQTANKVYLYKFAKEGAPHSSEDIEKVTGDEGMPKIPESFDLLVGGFPCQDYSVAKPRNASKGMKGPKGVLWWRIYEILEARNPRYVVLENVDLLVKSPSECRGRDFAIILKCLEERGYFVEWRVINAGDYGYIQRRRRTYIFAYRPDEEAKRKFKDLSLKTLKEEGLLNQIFRISDLSEPSCYSLPPAASGQDLGKIFQPDRNSSPFKAAGVMAYGKCISADYKAEKGKKTKQTLRNALLKKAEIRDESELEPLRIHGREHIEAWAYVKGRKDEIRRKLQPLEKYVETKTAGKMALSVSQMRDLAKTLPDRLKLDVLIKSPGKSKKLLTREDVNDSVRAVLAYEKKPLPNEAVISHDVVNKAFKSKPMRKRIEQNISLTLKNRSLPSRTLSQMTCKTVSTIRQAIKYLSGKNIEYTYPTKEQKVTFDRDSVAQISIAYRYQEGAMAFPDPLNKPSRTIITSEGGPSVSRFKHVICELCARREFGHKPGKKCIEAGKLRRLHPTEVERLNRFPQSHSDSCADISPNKRIMLMGNAVVVDLLEDIFIGLAKQHISS
jgi:DNA (cytosine-5)-methyltransferase 1